MDGIEWDGMDGMTFLNERKKERNARSEDRGRDRDGDKGGGYANFCYEVLSGLDEIE